MVLMETDSEKWRREMARGSWIREEFKKVFGGEGQMDEEKLKEESLKRGLEKLAEQEFKKSFRKRDELNRGKSNVEIMIQTHNEVNKIYCEIYIEEIRKIKDAIARCKEREAMIRLNILEGMIIKGEENR